MNENTPLAGNTDWQTVQFEAAIKFLAKKYAVPAETMYEVSAKMQDLAFFVTGLTRVEAVTAVQNSLNQVLQNGGTFQDFKNDFKEAVAKQVGFQPREGVSNRAATVYETNIHTALNAGAMQQMRETVVNRPYARLSNGGGRVCPRCAMLSGVTMPIEAWDSRGGPPFHHRCRCKLYSFSQRQLIRHNVQVFDPSKDTLTLKNPKTGEEKSVKWGDTYQWKNPKTGQTENIPVGTSPTFNYPKGAVQSSSVIEQALSERVRSLPPAMASGIQSQP